MVALQVIFAFLSTYIYRFKVVGFFFKTKDMCFVLFLLSEKTTMIGIVFKNQNTRDIMSKVKERRRVVALSSAALVSAIGHGVPF